MSFTCLARACALLLALSLAGCESGLDSKPPIDHPDLEIRLLEDTVRAGVPLAAECEVLAGEWSDWEYSWRVQAGEWTEDPVLGPVRMHWTPPAGVSPFWIEVTARSEAESMTERVLVPVLQPGIPQAMLQGIPDGIEPDEPFEIRVLTLDSLHFPLSYAWTCALLPPSHTTSSSRQELDAFGHKGAFPLTVEVRNDLHAILLQDTLHVVDTPPVFDWVHFDSDDDGFGDTFAAGSVLHLEVELREANGDSLGFRFEAPNCEVLEYTFAPYEAPVNGSTHFALLDLRLPPTPGTLRIGLFASDGSFETSSWRELVLEEAP